jgi:hypothetical protein
MPFKSKAQQRFLYAKHPDIAKRWQREYGTPKKLPEKKNINERIKKA